MVQICCENNLNISVTVHFCIKHDEVLTDDEEQIHNLTTVGNLMVVWLKGNSFSL